MKGYTKKEKRSLVKQYKAYEQGEYPLVGGQSRHERIVIYEPSTEQIHRMLFQEVVSG